MLIRYNKSPLIVPLATRFESCVQTMFKSAGGVFLDEHPVTEIVPGRDEVTIRTTKGTFRTKKLVITAGSWAPDLLRTLGVDLPLKVSRIG